MRARVLAATVLAATVLVAGCEGGGLSVDSLDGVTVLSEGTPAPAIDIGNGVPPVRFATRYEAADYLEPVLDEVRLAIDTAVGGLAWTHKNSTAGLVGCRTTADGQEPYEIWLPAWYTDSLLDPTQWEAAVAATVEVARQHGFTTLEITRSDDRGRNAALERADGGLLMIDTYADTTILQMLTGCYTGPITGPLLP